MSNSIFQCKPQLLKNDNTDLIILFLVEVSGEFEEKRPSGEIKETNEDGDEERESTQEVAASEEEKVEEGGGAEGGGEEGVEAEVEPGDEVSKVGDGESMNVPKAGPKKLTNQFNFCERAALTYNNPCRVSIKSSAHTVNLTTTYSPLQCHIIYFFHQSNWTYLSNDT